MASDNRKPGVPRRLIPIAFALLSACSQRSPWVTVAAPTPRPASTVTAAGETATLADATAVAHLAGLQFPVAGIDSTRLDDSFDDPRDGGVRRHHAIDIMAPRGSAVLAVQDGKILKLANTSKGGTSIYATDLDERFVYYYAHLDRYHEKIYAGRALTRGDTIGFVGTTGNAPRNAPHLHFQVMRMPPDKKYWIGEPINPYPLLRATTTANQ
jgi:murein DD-endopeptidase MepM/ murein hydrolase activator NlpD